MTEDKLLYEDRAHRAQVKMRVAQERERRYPQEIFSSLDTAIERISTVQEQIANHGVLRPGDPDYEHTRNLIWQVGKSMKPLWRVIGSPYDAGSPVTTPFIYITEDGRIGTIDTEDTNLRLAIAYYRDQKLHDPVTYDRPSNTHMYLKLGINKDQVVTRQEVLRSLLSEISMGQNHALFPVIQQFREELSRSEGRDSGPTMV